MKHMVRRLFVEKRESYAVEAAGIFADLRENLDHAFLARQLMPWGKTVPWDVFLHYVLPHRASQEPFQPHRAFLFAELAPLCATALSMEEALSRVGGWCAARAVTPTISTCPARPTP